MDQVDLDFLVEIAQEVEICDPMDWDRLSMGKEQAYKMVAASISEMFDKPEYNYDDKVIILSTMTKLVVENMLLNLKILTMSQEEGK
jgi:hypothetical protein